jgi:uncharacterized protein YcbK (DUF882 family)
MNQSDLPKPNESFTSWFSRQGFNNFTASELLSYFTRTRNGVRNSPPPRKLWHNILPPLRIVDSLRDEINKPIIILSSYRSPSYNKAIGGAAASYHMQFCALDIASSDISPSKIHSILYKWRKEKRFSGGLGLYENFVHIDTRGYNASW